MAEALPMLTADLEGYADNGTDEERSAPPETENAMQANEIRNLRTETEKARAAALEGFEAPSGRSGPRDIYSAAFGILASPGSSANCRPVHDRHTDTDVRSLV
ncbi:hypothetical protein A5782_10685 [Mycobacterium sp. 852002-40037_SCH5390672]|nr:hypothetical protein A5782_10685 [Mycobacterium sp. 852002-40037_SCH5390672]